MEGRVLAGGAMRRVVAAAGCVRSPGHGDGGSVMITPTGAISSRAWRQARHRAGECPSRPSVKGGSCSLEFECGEWRASGAGRVDRDRRERTREVDGGTDREEDETRMCPCSDDTRSRSYVCADATLLSCVPGGDGSRCVQRAGALCVFHSKHPLLTA